MAPHAVWKTWPSGLSNDKNLGLRPRFLSTESLGPCFPHGMRDHDQILQHIISSSFAHLCQFSQDAQQQQNRDLVKCNTACILFKPKHACTSIFSRITYSLSNHVTLYGLASPRLLHSLIDHIKTSHSFKHGYSNARWVVLYALVSPQWSHAWFRGRVRTILLPAAKLYPCVNKLGGSM